VVKVTVSNVALANEQSSSPPIFHLCRKGGKMSGPTGIGEMQVGELHLGQAEIIEPVRQASK